MGIAIRHLNSPKRPSAQLENLIQPLATAPGDYVKTKRALIRAVEKQADMSERMDLLKAELAWTTTGTGTAGTTGNSTPRAGAAMSAAKKVEGLLASLVL